MPVHTVVKLYRPLWYIHNDMPMNRHGKLAEEILTMAHRDQQMRKSGVWNAKVDTQNTERLKQIIAGQGWPTISLVGKAAAGGAWLLAQHADLDVVFQKRVLALMKKAAKRNEADADRKHIAYLIDRIRVNTGRPQVYGTQFFSKDRKVWKPRPIEKPEHLDARRAEMGMQPFVEYEALLRRTIQKYSKKKK